jgi:uncharacterized membrane protein
MSEEPTKSKTSNVPELSWGLLLGGALLAAVSTRLRLIAAVPLFIVGAASAVSGASMRPTANRLVGSIFTEEDLWIKLKSSVSVMHSTREIYDYWRDPLNWPRFMPDIDIEKAGTDRYELTKRIAPGVELKQQILITEDLPYHKIAWVSLSEELPYRGGVEFTTNGGTYVTLTWDYKYALGPAVNGVSKQLLRKFNEVLLIKLQRFKQLMEQGGATTFGPTNCKSSSAEILLHVLKSDADRAFADMADTTAASEAS